MKSKNTQDKLRVLAVGILALLVISTLVIFAVTIYKNDNVALSIGSIVVAIVVLVFAISILKRQYTSVKKGFPYQDERSKKIMILAGYYSFLISIWLFLAIGWSSSNGWVTFRDPSQATGMGILGMAIIFGLCWLWLNWKGKTE